MNVSPHLVEASAGTSCHSLEPLLEIRGLKTHFHREQYIVKAVDGISLTIYPGRTTALVGESGSGKTVTSLSILRLLPTASAEIVSGEICFLGRDLVKLPRRDLQHIRGHQISMIFQEPGTALNPVYQVGEQVAEVLRIHLRTPREKAYQRTLALFHEVGLPDPERCYHSYPHELSGGQKQRVMISMALACDPKLLIADEPTTALDVTIQRQILDLLCRLQRQHQMAMLFITHDLGVISEIAHDVAVMYRGRIVEYGRLDQIFLQPQHPYTRGLLACRPRLDSSRRRLPTISDYMDVREDERGELVITPRELTEEKQRLLEQRGRPKLLHPREQIEQMLKQRKDAEHCLADLEHRCQTGEITFLETQQPLLSVRNLRVYYPIYRGWLRRISGYVKAVDDISFDLYPGQTLGLVGESGCGKTTTGRALLRLTPVTTGSVLFRGISWQDLSPAALRRERRRFQIIFQDPYNSLNPRLTVEEMLVEAMQIHRLGKNSSERRDRAVKILEEVGLSATHLKRYPHEFSGGQRQRLGIARALAVEPECIVCDECVSALDVSVQAQVLNLLKDLQEKHRLAYIFISHDLSVVRFMADMMAVMYAGRFVEFGPAETIYRFPESDYTRALIEAVPQVDSPKIIQRFVDHGLG